MKRHMKAATLLFPHQLFKPNPALRAGVPVYLVEEFLFFRQYPFHKNKILLHRASMKYYEEWLLQEGFEVEYIDSADARSDVRQLVADLSKKGCKELLVIDVVDDWLRKRLVQSAQQHQVSVNLIATPNFLNTKESTDSFFSNRKTYFQTDFYTWQRKQRTILLDEHGKPAGGKWTFDAENREKFPKGKKAPPVSFPKDNRFVTEARSYTNCHFESNYGSTDPFFYPVTHAAAEQWLTEFLETRFHDFGVYEDAMVKAELILHHSVLTPMLNTGLLNPQQILDKALATAQRNNTPLNSVEGFVRQIMGWREFIRLVYEREGVRQRTTNYWGFNRKIPASFYTGTTGIEPIDIVIRKVLKTGYCHHIERLMVLGNFMLLCEFDPDDVYRWFMELFIDAYDWVMVPNVYGMTQFADGGLMTTKPYISGSNYLLKMGDWNKGNWTATWDGLFWRFMHVHRSFFLQNPRLGMLLKTFDKMPEARQQEHLSNAEQFLNQLDQV